MAVAITNLAAPGGLNAKVAEFAASWIERAAKRRLYRRTYRELAALSGNMLDDLGIDRSSIGAVAYEATYGT